jgi:hypothetical protein
MWDEFFQIDTRFGQLVRVASSELDRRGVLDHKMDGVGIG